MKRGPYKAKKLTGDRQRYDQTYYQRNRERILAQHRLRYIIRKGERHGANEIQRGV
jgi:hypothetical protein